MTRKRIFYAFLTGLFLLSVIPQAFAQDDVIKKRQKLMKSNSKAWGFLRKAVKKEEKDYAKIESNAKLIVANMDKVLDLFPKGSTSKKSRAKAEIWEQWDEFSKNPAKVKTAAQALADAAMAKDGSQAALEFKALNTACRSCHRPFRKRRKRKR